MLEAVIQPTVTRQRLRPMGKRASRATRREKIRPRGLCDIDMKPMDGITLPQAAEAVSDPGAVVII